MATCSLTAAAQTTGAAKLIPVFSLLLDDDTPKTCPSIAIPSETASCSLGSSSFTFITNSYTFSFLNGCLVFQKRTSRRLFNVTKPNVFHIYEFFSDEEGFARARISIETLTSFESPQYTGFESLEAECGSQVISQRNEVLPLTIEGIPYTVSFRLSGNAAGATIGNIIVSPT